MLETVEECRKVAAAAGGDPGEKGMQTVRGYLTQKGSRFAASMLHDLEKAAMVEADHIVGDMIAAREEGGHRHAQPAHGLCPFAGLSRAAAPAAASASPPSKRLTLYASYPNCWGMRTAAAYLLVASRNQPGAKA